ncbi:hypothetical protein [Arthrobacter sp. UYCo732]|uniref:hypothetical protein n=1 Tax=Arthrobacter sp. UYCo732 TaxID=3156336 RepID=UPI003390DED1
MTDEQQDPKAYWLIRDLAAELVGVLDQLRFEPLFDRHPGIVSVVGLMSGEHLAGHEDMLLTLWRGNSDGLVEDEGFKQGLWLHISQMPHGPGRILPLDPDKADFGADLHEAVSGDEALRSGIDAMLTLLKLGSPVHRGQTDVDLAFGVLNQAIDEGVAGSRPGPDGAKFDEDSELVSDMEHLCAASDLESVEFGQYGPSGAHRLATRAFLDVSDQLTVTVWSDEDGFNWVDVAGSVQRMDSPELVFPGEDQEEADEVAALTEQLAEIHDAASAIFDELNTEEFGLAFDLLNSVAYAAMNGALKDVGPDVRPWHQLADLFGSHCRLGFLAGVMLEESPLGNLNIRATTRDPATKNPTHLQVYWKQDDEQDVPEHWLSVGTATGPAHDVDPEYPELLTTIPEAGQEYIRHAIDHLHQMVHLAGSVLEARTHETLHFLALRRATENVTELIEHEMVRDTIDETIAGLNGIALLYTGAMPED